MVSCSEIRVHSSAEISTRERPLPKTNPVSERRVARSSSSASNRYARRPRRSRSHAAASLATCPGRQCRYAPAARRVRSSLSRSSTSDRVRTDPVPLEVAADPLRGRGQALVERDSRLPLHESTRLTGVGAETLDLAAGGTDTGRVEVDGSAPLDDGLDPLCKIADRNLATGADVDDP